MTTTPNPPPIFTHLLNPQLPPHIVQSADLQHLTCRRCSTTTNLSYEPNYHKFIYEHTHLPPYPTPPTAKPWPSFPE